MIKLLLISLLLAGCQAKGQPVSGANNFVMGDNMPNLTTASNCIVIGNDTSKHFLPDMYWYIDYEYPAFRVNKEAILDIAYYDFKVRNTGFDNAYNRTNLYKRLAHDFNPNTHYAVTPYEY